MSKPVNGVPLLLRPFHRLFFTLLALVFLAWYWVLRKTCRVTWVIPEATKELPNAIYGLWHHNFMPYFCFFPSHQRHSWMMHPAWYMEHIVVTTRLLGVERLRYGSTHHSGREAADLLVKDLKEGFSTSVAVDGPSGPALILKKGILHMAAQSGVPVVAIRFDIPHPIYLPFTWEGKRFPFPFSKLTITLSEPFHITPETMAQFEGPVTKALG